ncbi:MAG: hypothetical protein COW04_03045 [Deltaproteobacteria bacterium CG12_big_fil_rev_8_21_14_0_65_43_10]|nr:MAG: hypothetical protein AUK23_05205 [Deltaproteobacteria bacterium CG2_30_43_15]PIQ46267.1 MAG: hypothetical protein COW04_03045 [Deltaproteobacteria bacterium CG12_big_fil_rev_8_21_14_0_65_43_10]PIU85240.1 MAG: hypothetical protein COS67_08860 [Deltaproteobacteria bacterium CG06_land_8_20_14_3_00_44_19]PIX26734.1 MAG: hypothetical protein COZ68_00370 [Deltaproteobacteria bacterium CG_4_8_14_3_um_filter_43_13]PIZ18431.1 MAG: hypothetical protein COY50_15335 [Deltaproteobacteria bacterium C
MGDSCDLIIEQIRKATKSIKIYGGEGYYVYNNPDVISEFRQIKEDNPELEIKVILSPIIFVEAKIIGSK